MKISTISFVRLIIGLLVMFSSYSTFSNSELKVTNNNGLSNSTSQDLELLTEQTTFAIIGDFGSGNNDEAAVANLVKSWNPEFIVTTGDNRYGSIDFDLAVGRDYCEFLNDAQSGTFCNVNSSTVNAFFPSTGNHDHTDGGNIAEYLNYFNLPGAGVQTSGTSGSELYYDFIQGPIHFFVIDSYTATNDGDVQKNWLQLQMAASTSIWKVVYFHHPPYSSSSSHGSTEAMRWPFSEWGADAVLNGHDHTYERLHHDGVVYFVNGLGGKSTYNFGDPIPESAKLYNAEYGAQRVVADDESMSFSFINVSGVLIDNYTITKNVAGNNDPVFTSNPIIGKQDAEIGIDYNSSIFNDANDIDGDPLIFSKISGPDWLGVSVAGILSGVPENGALGLNSFTVQVTDNKGGIAQAELQITVKNQPPPPVSGTVESQITIAIDDVEEKLSDGSIYVNSTDIELGNDPGMNGDQHSGLYFRNIYVPQGAHITNAYIEFETDETGNTTTEINIKAHNIANAPEFTTANYNLTARPTTSNFVTWNIPEWNVTSEKHQTPNISSVIQEIIDNPDWIYNNNIAILIDGTGTRTAEAYEGEPENAAKLYIDYDNELCDGIDNDGDGQIDEGYPDSDNDGIADCADNTTCEPDTRTFMQSTISTTGKETNITSTGQLPEGAKDISFSISGLDQKPEGKPIYRYIEEVTVIYVDEKGITQNYGVLTGDDGSSVDVNIPGIVQSVSVALADGYDGISGTNMSVNLSSVNFCVETISCSDTDNDGICDADDRCPGFDDMIDIDADGIPDDCDNCIDIDLDNICDDDDNCPSYYNPNQDTDNDCDGVIAADDCDDNDANIIISNKDDSDGDGVNDCLDKCPGFDDNIDLNGNGTPDGCDVPDCTNTTVNFDSSTLTYPGSGSNTTTLYFPAGGQDIEFTISDIDERSGGKPSKRFIENVTVTYTDGSGTEIPYVISSGTSVVVVSILGIVQSVTVSLTNSYDENSSISLSVDLSPVSYCAPRYASQLKSGNTTSLNSNITEPNSLLENENATSIKVYPNPFNREINIKIDSEYKFENVTVNITDLAGKIKFSKVYGFQKIISLNNLELQSGTYFVRIQLGSFVKTERIIKFQ